MTPQPKKNKLEFANPQVMAILNITPNSFSEVGRHASIDSALQHAAQAVKAGATIIDVGGEPTNPGVFPVVSMQQELDRVIPVVEAIAREFPVIVSVDTSKPAVMQAALEVGMGLINDVRALTEPGALEVAAKADVPVCLMHMAYPYGLPSPASCRRPAACPRDPAHTDVKLNVPVNWIPASMPGRRKEAWSDSTDIRDDSTEDITSTVKTFLKRRREVCIAAGIKPENIIIDPGIGHGNFGKNLHQNLQLLNQLKEFKELQSPILVGVSRKTFIGELLDVPVESRLSGSLAAAVLAVVNGASIIRAHDVRETVEAVKVAMAILQHS
jgi:dihydropteroate synthase